MSPRRAPRPLTILGLATLLAGAATAHSDPGGEHTWPQWRGPDRNGISLEKGWSPEGRELWSVEVGIGYSCPSIVDGRLYTMGYDVGEALDIVQCLDAETGKSLWTHSYPAKRWARMHGGGTQTTPAVADGKVYTVNREGLALCLAAADGEVLWSHATVDENGVKPPRWGFAGSPLVLDDRVILNVGKTLSIEADTGELVWESRDRGAAYATPVDFDLGSRHCLAVIVGDGLTILDRKRGAEILFHEWTTDHDVNAATPVIFDDRVFISSGYGHGCAMLELGKKKVRTLWENKNMRNHMATAILFEEHLFGFDESILKCLDLEGEEQWRKRGLGKGAISVADGKLLALSSRGDLVIAEATSEEYRELSRTRVLPGGECWTMPVLCNGLIYCRNSKGQLVCRDHRPAQKD